MDLDILQKLVRIIDDRKEATEDVSYTKQLLNAGPERCAKKLGEEAVETVIALVAQDDDALKAEAADLLYHLLVALACRNIALEDVLGLLEQRMGVSGLDEKAARTRG
ncbi:MAG: phosphoribosyl-ATP diphosphatase [Pseudomonadota bacterium]